MRGLTEAVAEFIQTKTLQDVPFEALDKAKKAIADTASKRFPCCYASHRGMDGVLQL